VKRYLIIISVFICVCLAFSSCTLFQESTTVQVRFADECSLQQQTAAHQVIIDRLKTVYKVKDYTQLDNSSFSVTYFPKKEVEILPDLLTRKGKIAIYESYYASEIVNEIVDILEDENELLEFIFSVPNFSKELFIGRVQEKDTALIVSLLQRNNIKKRLPRDVAFVWMKDDAYFLLVAVRESRFIPLNQEAVKKVMVEESPYPRIDIEFDFDFSKEWAAMTRRNIERYLPIVCDGQVLSAPIVMSEITGGKSSLSGNFTTEELHTLAGIIKGGVLDCSAYINNSSNQ